MNDQTADHKRTITDVSIWPMDAQPTLNVFEGTSSTMYCIHLERHAGVSIFFEDLDQITAWVDTLSALLTDTYLIHPDQAPLPLEVTS